jgi:hypothetical protein
MSAVLFVVAVFMSMFQTFLISLHRFLVATNSPWNNRLFQGKRKYAIYLITWSTVLTCSFVFVNATSGGDVKVCNVRIIYGGNFQLFFSVYGVLAMILLISTILLYITTVNSVRKRYMKTFALQIEMRQLEAGHATPVNPAIENNTSTAEIRKRKMYESLKVVGIVIAILILFTSPFVIFVLLNLGTSHSTIVVVSSLACLNSALNPFVYCWKIESVRKEFKLFFRSCLTTEQQQ